MWTKYEYLCLNCDALIEVSTKVTPILTPDCVCGHLSDILQINSYVLTTT